MNEEREKDSNASRYSAFGVITRNKAEASYMIEWCEAKGWPPPTSLGKIAKFPWVACLDFVREDTAWTDRLDRAMEYKTFAEFIEKNAQVDRLSKAGEKDCSPFRTELERIADNYIPDSDGQASLALADMREAFAILAGEKENAQNDRLSKAGEKDKTMNNEPKAVVNSDVRQVATLRLPVGVKSLDAIVDGLTQEYGSGLTMRQAGGFLVIEQPNAEVELPLKDSIKENTTRLSELRADVLLDWLEACEEAWVTIDRRYDMHGRLYFGVQVSSRQSHTATTGLTIREALQHTMDQYNESRRYEGAKQPIGT